MTWRNERPAIGNDVVEIAPDPNHYDVYWRGDDLRIDGMHALVISYFRIGVGKGSLDGDQLSDRV